MVVLILALFGGEDPAGGPEPWSLLDGIYSTRFRDVEFVAEAKLTDREGRSLSFYRARTWWFADGILRMEVGAGDVGSAPPRLHGMKRDGTFVVKGPPQTKIIADANELMHHRYPTRTWLVPYLSFLSAEDRARTTIHASEVIGGRRCMVFSFVAEPKPKSELKFWIDLERDAVPLRVEWYLDGNLFHRWRDIVVKEYRGADGVNYWFPQSMFVDTLVRIEKDKPVYTSEPQQTEHRYIEGSVLINRGLRSADYEVRVDPQQPVFDPRQRTLVKNAIRSAMKSGDIEAAREFADKELGELMQTARPSIASEFSYSIGLCVVALILLTAAIIVRRRSSA